MPAIGSVASMSWVDASAATKAAARLSNLVIGPRPSRTNPTGGRTSVLDPRAAITAAMPGVATFCLEKIREYTPVDTSKTRQSYNVRRGFGGGSSKGSFDFVSFEVVSDLPDAEQVVVATLEFGSVPHVIRARNAKFMRIPLDAADVPAEDAPRPASRGGGYAFIKREAGGAILLAKSVQHPGTSPHGMFRKTLEDVRPVAERVAREVVAAVSDTWSDESVNAMANATVSQAMAPRRAPRAAPRKKKP